MRHHLLVNLIILGVLSLAGYGLMLYFDQTAQPTSSPLARAADFTFTTTSGERSSLEAHQGKLVIINFWASWCAPCVKEFPALIDVARKNAADTVLIALSYDLKDEAMMDFLKKMKAQGHNWEDPAILIARDETDVAGKLYGITRFPETLIIDSQGQIRDRFVGADWTADDMNNSLQKLRAVP